jgi:hypothetical protein
MLEKISIGRNTFLCKIGFITTTLVLSGMIYWCIPETSRNFIVLGNLFNKNISSEMLKSKPVYSENMAAIVEHRPTPHLVTTVLNVIQNIPENWQIQIFHSELNAEFLRNSRLSKHIQSGKIILTKLTTFGGQDSHHYTNKLFTNISFWEQVLGEKVLFFQIDSIMCSNSPHKITDYLQYDYIGAPWSHREPRVGNGGFSLRSKNKTLLLLEKMRNSSTLTKFGNNEDVFYSLYMSSVGTIAPLDVAKTFAVEGLFYANPVGVHKTGINKKDLQKLCEECPDARLVPPYCN